MVVCDFNMRFTFVLAGWPGSVHDMRPFKDALSRFSHKFPHPPPEIFYLVDSGYPNKADYLAPYRGQKYHFQEFHQGTMPRGMLACTWTWHIKSTKLESWRRSSRHQIKAL
ncbi:hypothetical protein VPH35_061405 [Triticum aestivum]